jgi:hypothetical protein
MGGQCVVSFLITIDYEKIPIYWILQFPRELMITWAGIINSYTGLTRHDYSHKLEIIWWGATVNRRKMGGGL